MTGNRLRIVILGLSITSSWGNGHATIYRALVRALSARGHDVLFLERDVPWYAANRDLPAPPYGRTALYGSLEELFQGYRGDVGEADLAIVGSYVPEGAAVGEWAIETARGVTAFYDIDTPVTLARLARGECEYLRPDLIPRYGLYLSFTGGPVLAALERTYGARAARPLYCAVDPDLHRPVDAAERWDLGYMGTYSPDRQPTLDRLLLEPARRWRDGRWVVAGPQYPETVLIGGGFVDAFQCDHVLLLLRRLSGQLPGGRDPTANFAVDLVDRISLQVMGIPPPGAARRPPSSAARGRGDGTPASVPAVLPGGPNAFQGSTPRRIPGGGENQSGFSSPGSQRNYPSKLAP